MSVACHGHPLRKQTFEIAQLQLLKHVFPVRSRLPCQMTQTTSSCPQVVRLHLRDYHVRALRHLKNLHTLELGYRDWGEEVSGLEVRSMVQAAGCGQHGRGSLVWVA